MKKNKKVIYSAMIGNYDDIHEPIAYEDWDFVMFTDKIPHTPTNTNGWQFKSIDPTIADTPALINRWYKMHPHKLFADYSHSLYIDGNIILDNPEKIDQRLIQLVNFDTLIAITDHPYRDCIFEESIAVLQNKKDTPESVETTMKLLRSKNYPINNGLFENNMIFRSHHNTEVISLMEQWWEFINTYSPRDQLSLCYLLWENKICAEPLFNNGISARNHPHITFFPEHKADREARQKKEEEHQKNLRAEAVTSEIRSNFFYRAINTSIKLIPLKKIRLAQRDKLRSRIEKNIFQN